MNKVIRVNFKSRKIESVFLQKGKKQVQSIVILYRYSFLFILLSIIGIMILTLLASG